MKIGTKSVLFGAHAFYLHPWFVAFAWWRLFGFPWDPRLWVAFFVHDLGYIGKPNMDGEQGDWHPVLGARIMSALFDPRYPSPCSAPAVMAFVDESSNTWVTNLGRCGQFTLLHSRFFAKRFGMLPSRLCIADKLATCITPAWLYLPMVNLTGEVHEYMALAQQREGSKYTGEPVNKYETMQVSTASQRAWFDGMTSYMRRWVEEHRDGRVDTWTPDVRAARDEKGVWT